MMLMQIRGGGGQIEGIMGHGEVVNGKKQIYIRFSCVCPVIDNESKWLWIHKVVGEWILQLR